MSIQIQNVIQILESMLESHPDMEIDKLKEIVETNYFENEQPKKASGRKIKNDQNFLPFYKQKYNADYYQKKGQYIHKMNYFKKKYNLQPDYLLSISHLEPEQQLAELKEYAVVLRKNKVKSPPIK